MFTRASVILSRDTRRILAASLTERVVHSMEEVFRLSRQQATERRGPDKEKGESQGEDHTSSCTLPRHA